MRISYSGTFERGRGADPNSGLAKAQNQPVNMKKQTIRRRRCPVKSAPEVRAESKSHSRRNSSARVSIEIEEEESTSR